MKIPADQAQRDTALDPSRSFIVQAPAGSGKTGLLVRRYLLLLSQVTQPEEVLAITFTRKATFEMRHRIVCALQGNDDDGHPLKDKQLLQLVDAVKVNDVKHKWQLLKHTRRLRIQTIDSFCSELVRRMPWSSRFGGAPGIIEDSQPLRLQAAQLALQHIDRPQSEWRGDCEQILSLTDANLWQAQQLLASMLGSRDKWLRVLQQHSRNELEAMWHDLVADSLQTVSDQLDEFSKKALTEIAQIAAGHLVKEKSNSLICLWVKQSDFPLPNADNLSLWQGLTELLLTNEGALRKAFNKNIGLPPTEKEIKQRLAAIVASLADSPPLLNALSVIPALPDGEFSDDQWNTLASLYRLLPLAAAELQLLFKQQNQADFTEISQRAELALGPLGQPSDLALTFDYELRHLLVDEFQDTSASQIQLIEKLTSGWQSDDGRTVFFVGDPMQSIYLFRQAEVSHFLNVQQRGIGDLDVEPLALTSNFRSSPALVNWFNQAFTSVLPPQDDAVKGAVSYSSAEAFLDEKPDTGLMLHSMLDGDPLREAEHVAQSIAQTLQTDPNQTIAVLGRTRRHLITVADALRTENVSFQAVDLESLANTQHVQDLVMLTRAILHSADRAAWLSLLRTPWCGMTLADITVLAEHDWQRLLWLQMNDTDIIENLSADGQHRLAHVCRCLAPSLEQYRRISLRDNVEACWLRLSGPANLTESALDDCLVFFDKLTQLESDKTIISANALQQVIDQLWARPESISNVQLLTVHKSKGLEYDQVYLPSLSGKAKGIDRELLRWIVMPDRFLISPRPPSRDRNNRFFKYLGTLQSELQQNELGRLLYVACTRARKQLHLYVSVTSSEEGIKTPASNTFLGLLWPALQTPVEEQIALQHGNVSQTDEPPTPIDMQYCLPRFSEPTNSPTLAAGILVNQLDDVVSEQIEFSWATEIARVAGIVIHRELQHIDTVGWQHWRKTNDPEQQQQNWLALLIAHGLTHEQLDQALLQVTTAITNTREDERAAWIFSKEHQSIKSEWPLTGMLDGRLLHLVIDRSFVDEQNTRWIIDFKSSRHDESDVDVFLATEQRRYAAKMAQYADVVRALEPDKDIRLALYFPVLKAWKEWRPPD